MYDFFAIAVAVDGTKHNVPHLKKKPTGLLLFGICVREIVINGLMEELQQRFSLFVGKKTKLGQTMNGICMMFVNGLKTEPRCEERS